MPFQTNSFEPQINSDIQWLSKVACLNCNAATRIAVCLLIHGESGESFSISPEFIKRLKISRATSHRALRLLEAAGLVSIERRRGASPAVTIVNVDSRFDEYGSDDDHWDNDNENELDDEKLLD